MSCLNGLAPCTVKLWGLCCCGVSPETNPMHLQDPCSSALCHPSQLACCSHGCQPQPVGGAGAVQAPSLPAVLRAGALSQPSQQTLASPCRAGLAHHHPGASRAAASCRAEGADLSLQIQLVPSPLSGAWRGFSAPASRPGRSPSPRLWSAAGSLPGGPGCQAVRGLPGPPARGCLCGTGSLPAHTGSPAKGEGLDGCLPEGHGVQPASGGLWGWLWASSGCSPASLGVDGFGKGLPGV